MLQTIVAVFIFSFSLASDNYAYEEQNFSSWKFGLNVGYAGVDLKSVEADLNTEGNLAVDSFLTYLHSTGSNGTASYTLTEVSGGINLAGNLLYMLNDNIGIGARLNYIKPNDMELKVKGSGIYSESYSITNKLSFELISPLFEICLQNSNLSGLEYGLIIGGGIGFGDITQDMTVRLIDPFYNINQSSSASVSSSGSGFDFYMSANAGYKVSEIVTLFAMVGYNYCNINEMTSNENVDFDGDGVYDILKGDKYKDSSGEIVNFDFSGISINAGIRFSF